MYSQFERQYSDFLRSHLTQLDISNNRSTEEELLSHLNSYLNTSTNTSPGTALPSFGPKLTRSSKSDDLSRAHVLFAEELVERNGLVLALSELGEAVKNSVTMETLVLGLAVRVVVLERLGLFWEMRSDFDLIKSICCRDCYRAIFTKPKQKKSSSNENRSQNHYQTFVNKFGQVEKCPLTKQHRSKLRDLQSKHSRGSPSSNVLELECSRSSSSTPHNPPRTCSTPALASEGVLSEEYSFVSSKVRIEQSEERGRFVRANEDIQIGAVLAVEEASVWTVLPERWSSHCQFCLNVCRAPLPCLNCPDVVFCSVECLEQDSVHQLECGYTTELQTLPKMVYLAFRTVLKFHRDILLHSQNKTPSTEYTQLINLITNLSLRSPIDILRRTTLAIFLSNLISSLSVFSSCSKYSFVTRSGAGRGRDQVEKVRRGPKSCCQADDSGIDLSSVDGQEDEICERREEEVSGYDDGKTSDNHTESETMMSWETNQNLCEGYLTVGDVHICVGNCIQGSRDLSKVRSIAQIVLLKCLQSYPCNAHEISELQIHPTEFRYSANEDIGAGAFPFLSLLNHSCNPNVVRHSIGKKTVLRALRRISSGTEILDNYGYHYATHSASDRRKALKTQYLFTCQCQPCVERKMWPNFGDVPSGIMLRCGKCKTRVPAQNTCISCGHNLCKLTLKLDKAGSEATCFIHRFVKDSNPAGYISIVKFLKLAEAYASPPFRLYNECQEVIKQVWNLQSNSMKPITS